MNEIEREDILEYFDIEDQEPDYKKCVEIAHVIKALNSMRKMIDEMEREDDPDTLKGMVEDLAWECAKISDAAEMLEEYESFNTSDLINIIRHRLEEDEIEEILHAKTVKRLKGK